MLTWDGIIKDAKTIPYSIFFPLKSNFANPYATKAPKYPVRSVYEAEISIFEDHVPWIRKTHVVLEYCKPIYINELDKSDKRRIGALVQDVIKEAYFKNKELV